MSLEDWQTAIPFEEAAKLSSFVETFYAGCREAVEKQIFGESTRSIVDI